MSEQLCVHGEVSGRVQGVFYRASFCREARSKELTGWVRNLPDGRVAFLIQGEPEAVGEMLVWARVGPSGARVNRVDSQERDVDGGLAGFEIRR